MFLSAGIKVEATSVSVDASLFLSGWDNAFGEPALTINSFGVGLEISAGATGEPSVGFELSGNLAIGVPDDDDPTHTRRRQDGPAAVDLGRR